MSLSTMLGKLAASAVVTTESAARSAKCGVATFRDTFKAELAAQRAARSAPSASHPAPAVDIDVTAV